MLFFTSGYQSLWFIIGALQDTGGAVSPRNRCLYGWKPILRHNGRCMYWFLCSPDQLQFLNASYVGFFLFVKVQDSSDVINEGRVRVVFSVPCEPQLDALILNQHVSLGSVKKSVPSILYTILRVFFFLQFTLLIYWYLPLYIWPGSACVFRFYQ